MLLEINLLILFFIFAFTSLALVKCNVNYFSVRHDNGNIFFRRFIKVFFLFTPFLIYTAFRDISVGTDTLAYFHEFELAKQGEELRSSEFLFSKLLVFFSSFGFSFSVFLIVTAYLYYFAISLATVHAKRLNSFIYVFLCVSFFLFTFGLSGVRQSLAISFFLLAIPFCRSRKGFFVFIMLLLIAFFIHNSSLFAFLILIFFRFIKIRITPSRFIFLLLLAPFFSLVSNTYLYFLPLDFIKQFSIESLNNEQTLGYVIVFFAWCFSLLFGLIMLFGKRLGLFQRNHDWKSFFCEGDLVLVFTVVFNCLLWISTSIRLADRLSFYFVPFFAIFIASIVAILKKDMRGRFFTFAIGCFCLFVFIYMQRRTLGF